MELYQSLLNILLQGETQKKFSAFDDFYDRWKSGAVFMDHKRTPEKIERPSYEGHVQVVSPADLPRRTNLHTEEGRRHMVHAIAHIEYSAVDLALDHAYRFRFLPHRFYDDWIEVAKEEIEHFKMLQSLLGKLDCKYGDLPVHSSLFEAAVKTPTLRSRMAVVPRHLEASGLDANPRIVKKISIADDAFSRDAKSSLSIILQDEIDHVKKGDAWFRYACERDGVSIRTFRETVEEVFPGSYSSPGRISMNMEARKKAGFSEEELRELQSR